MDLSELARALPSHAVLQLTLESGTTLDVPKAAVSLASRVLRHALEAEPDVKSLKVQGSDAAWSRLKLYLLPVSPSAYTPMSPALLLEVLPVAHLYDFQPAFNDCMSAAKGLSYSADEPGYGSTAADPLAFIAMAEKLQVPELQHGAFEFISSLLRQVGGEKACISLLQDLQEDSQPSIDAFLAIKARRARLPYRFQCKDNKCSCCGKLANMMELQKAQREKLRSAHASKQQNVESLSQSLSVLQKRVQENAQLSPAVQSVIFGLIGSV